MSGRDSINNLTVANEPRRDGEPVFDLLVIGGGVIGLSVAYHVLRARPGWRVAVLDRPTQSGRASRAAAGMLAPNCEFKEASPLAELCSKGLEYHAHFLADLERETGADTGLRRRGALLPVFDDAEMAVQTARADALADRGVEARMLARNELRQLSPGIGDAVVGGLFLPGEATVDSRRLHDALSLSVAARGGRQLAAAPARFEPGSPGEGNCLLGDGGAPIRFRRLLIAAGAWTGQLEKLLGVHIPVEPMKGQLMLVDADPEALGCVLHTHELYLAPRTGEGIVIGATMDDAGFDTELDDAVTERYLQMAARLYPPVTRAEVKECWTGLRPRPADGLPVMGALPRGGPWGEAGAWIATGHFRNGILLSGITGAIMAGEIAGERLADDVASVWRPEIFSPERFLAASARGGVSR